MNRNFFRVDRLATLHVAKPLCRILNKGSDSTVSILMYHSISIPDGRFPNPYFETCTSPQIFERHMKYLSENGYASIGFSELLSAIENGNGKKKYVVLTFDDGYKDFLVNASPIMHKYGFTSTVFLATGMMGTKSSMLGGKEILDWTDVSELRKLDVKFGAHTVTHRILKKLSIKEVNAEVWESKNQIETRLGEPIDAFSYPYAFPEGREGFLAAYFEILKRCGYRFGITTAIGRVRKDSNLLALQRIPVNEYDDPALFKAKLEGAYDWVHVPQYLRKRYSDWIGE